MAEPPGPVIECSYTSCIDSCSESCCKNETHTRPNLCNLDCYQDKDRKCAFHVIGQWEMREQKYMTHAFYCKRCDMNFPNYDDLTRHEVESMTPWLVGERKNEKKKFKHIVYESYGEEFKSLGRRTLHQQHMHPAHQKIVCKGSERIWHAAEAEYVVETCGLTFSSESAYISHIEHVMCRFVKKDQLEGARHHKKALKDIIMENPEKFGANLRGREHFLDERQKEIVKERLDIFADGSTEPSGIQSAGPMNNDDTDQVSNISLLQPVELTQSLMDSDMTKSVERDKVLGAFPGLAIEEGFGEIFPGLSSMSFPTTIRAGSGQLQVADGSPSSPTSDTQTEVSSTSDTASNAVEDRGTNLLTSSFWDSASPDYGTTIFIGTELLTTGKLVFPWPEYQSVFDVASGITTQIREFHTSAPSRYELCYKTFKNYTAFLQHYKSSTRGDKCQVAKTSYFLRLLDEATGGLLSVTKISDEKIWGLQMPGNKVGDLEESELPVMEKVDGVRSYSYKAHLPPYLTETQW